MRKLALVLIIAFTMRLLDARRKPRTNYNCPVLERCICLPRKDGFRVSCKSIAADEKFNADMAKLQGLYLHKISLIKINVTNLPAFWFTNHTIARFRVIQCGLRGVSEDALSSIKALRSVQLYRNELQSVPVGLSAAKGLQSLLLGKNRIKRLQGMLDLPELLRLDLSHNRIETIDEKYLSGLPKLRYLVLSLNSIHELLPQLFRKTTSLIDVKLNDNRITSVKGVFMHLRRLEVLDLSKNNICDLDSLARFTLPYLKYLKELTLEQNCLSTITKLPSRKGQIRRLIFRDNVLTNITPGAFQQLEELTIIDLGNNSITNLNDSYFAYHSTLESIDLSMNKLNTVSGLFNTTRLIQVINLSFNSIVNISVAFRGLTELRELYLKNNVISSVPDEAFQDNVRLIHIDLTSNDIGWVGRNAFEGLLTLKCLHLHRNHIISLNSSVSRLPKLQYFGASYNAILRLEAGEFGSNAALTAIRLEENNITDVKRAFIGATSLQSLNLAGNQVGVLRRSDFALEMSNNAAVTIRNNPLVCDCRMAWLMDEDSDIQTRGFATCAEPLWLTGKYLRQLAHEDFLRWEGQCEPGCQCECHEGSLGGRDIGVNCSSATVGRIPRVFPEGTTRLDLSGNQLRHLDDTIRRAAPHLQVLSLKDNALLSINVASIPDTVHSLDLRGNKLTRLPFLAVTQLNLTSIWLSGNQYTCDCADYSFRQWIHAHQNVVPDARDVMCGKSGNLLVSRKQFVTLGQKDLCPAMIPRGVVYLLLAFGLLVLLLAISATYLRYKHALIIWLRGHGISGSAWLVVEDDTEKLFDVFVSFSSKDIDWIHGEIIPGLEAMDFSYCTYERNFKGGYLLQDIIRDAVACSRRTLLVLTENFLASEWCRLEFRLAHQRALQDNINRLVIVLLDELDPAELDEDLRLYVRSANYLRWGEPNFWDRLLHSLATRGAQRKLIVKGKQRPTLLTDNTTGAMELKQLI